MQYYLFCAIIIICSSGFSGLYAQNTESKITVTDIEGNIYPVAVIGSQYWMAENLKTRRYNDNKKIRCIPKEKKWYSNYKKHAPGFCWMYGEKDNPYIPDAALYNWYAVNTDKLCPVGWHVSTDQDWIILIEYLRNTGYADNPALVLKDTTGWLYNTNGTNLYGFSAVPNGTRTSTGLFVSDMCTWWCADEQNVGYALYRSMTFMSGSKDYIDNGKQDKGYGLSVRCVKDIQ